MGKEEALQLIKEAAETGATELDLIYQDLTELPPELFQLKNLTSLYLSYNQLTNLPPPLFQLKNLTRLGLSGLGLIKLPLELFQLKNLTELYLGGNQLSSLPPEFVQLTNLTKLNLSLNALSILPPEVFQLKQLTSLDFWGNQLTSLPPEIVQLTNLKELDLSYNPLVSPPVEIAEEGIEAIREYFTSLTEGWQELAEVKVILIGEGASGKTSLTRCLKGEKFNKHEETTHGIRIEELTLASASRSIRCKLWDFGGQEIMHATHQFFLSRRSLYVLVLDGRRDERPEYWLRYIESFGGGSPVLVVLNKYDTNPSFDLNQRFLKEKYPFIVDFYRTSCPRNYGIEELRQVMTEELAKLPMTKNRWPLSWFRAKEMLEEMDRPRIDYETFEGILAEAGVQGETTRNVLTAFLHDLGSVIHFEDFALDDNHVLAPKWVTGAVYKIINAEPLAKSKGLLKLDDLKQILQWQKGDDYIYYPGDHVYIIELMKKFELCYELNEREVLIPQLLGVAQPSFAFDETGARRFLLEYKDFFPPSIMPSFIVKRHQEIKDNLRWRTGVFLENPMLEATAVVKADNEARRIDIAVTGKESKVFLALIWLTFRELHTGFEGLKVSERIPLPEQPSISVAYESLLKSQEAGIEKVFPEDAKRAYTVKELLDGVHLENQAQGEKMLALAEGERKEGGLRGLIKKMNRYVEGELNVFGLKINYQNIAEDVLNRRKK
ncbi:COR domain-containing protein [Candidatus Electronema sp. PJ]|uniref:COR domain-containing protein n=1 Tax=Candidatus Electronema sp. PJ TaxID=3401572 RepID=UPI003AA8EE90